MHAGVQGGTWDHHPNLKWLKRFKNDTERRNFVTCGAAAGVAAAFRAPVGGLLFALEQLNSSWSEQLLLTCFFTTAIVSITIRMIMRICNQGGCGFFGDGEAIIFHIAEQDAQVCPNVTWGTTCISLRVITHSMLPNFMCAQLMWVPPRSWPVHTLPCLSLN